MKKLLLIGWLAVIGLSYAPAPADAGWPFCHSCCHHCSMKICVTPYNAFSPVCAGNFCCVGCNPFCCPPQQAAAPWACGPSGPPLCNSNCCESGCLPSTAPPSGTGGNNTGGNSGNSNGGAQTFTPPAPVAQSYPVPIPNGLVNPAGNYPQGYNPNYYNVANPYNAAPTMSVPNFNNQSNYNPYAGYGMNPYTNMNPYAGYGMNPYTNMNPYGGMNPYGR
jgi:hypothetical protein